MHVRVHFPDERKSSVPVHDLEPCPSRDSSSDGHRIDPPIETPHESAVLEANVPQTTDPQISNSELNDTWRSIGEVQESDPVHRSLLEKLSVPPIRCGADE